MKVECSCAFLPSDRFYPGDLHISFADSERANKIKTVEFRKLEPVFICRKPYAEIESEFEKCILYLFHVTDELLTV